MKQAKQIPPFRKGPIPKNNARAMPARPDDPKDDEGNTRYARTPFAQNETFVRIHRTHVHRCAHLAKHSTDERRGEDIEKETQRSLNAKRANDEIAIPE